MKQANTDLFDKILSEATEDEIILVDLTFNVTSRIIELMSENNMRQKDLADKLNKSEAEISKWLSGMHNFTLKTISKLEAVFKNSVIQTPNMDRKHPTEKQTIGIYHNTYSAPICYREDNQGSFANWNSNDMNVLTSFSGNTIAVNRRPAFVRVGDGYSKATF